MYEISSFRETSWTEPVILGGGGAGASGIEGYPSLHCEFKVSWGKGDGVGGRRQTAACTVKMQVG